MKKNTTTPTSTTPTYVGMDVAKATLQVHLDGHQIEFQNDAQGHARLSQQLGKLSRPHVICEATGGYERPIVQALHDLKILVSVLNPAHALAASRAQGKRAKTDRCDAEALTEYGQRYQPAAAAPVAAELREVTALTVWLKQLIENRALAQTQAEHQDDKFVQGQHEKLLAHYDQQIKTAEAKIKKCIESLPRFQQRVDSLVEIEGVGFRTALMMLVFLPELGTMNRGQTASLAGLAPWTRDSGTMKGKRSIGGGRSTVRAALYMSALSASRCNPILAAYYQGLKKRNKPSKVALTAVMRKLVIYMNHKLKALAAQPAEPKTKTEK
ncbi:MAG TPA: IS110 family transposase [Verrucomicrobiae bacterium]|nr:IS110 family transposase [Verrucomicrobiae bacterium]